MMKNTTWRARARRTLAVVSAAALAGGLAVVGAGSAAAADGDVDVTGGSAEWGVKQSFRNYITRPFVHGSTTVTPPATTLDSGAFGFEATGGTVTGTTADIAFAGTVAFAGHDLGDGPVLEMRFSNIRAVIDGDEGTLVADVTSREFTDLTTRGELVDYPAVELGEIDLSAAPLTVREGVASVTEAPVILTDAGEPAYGAFYEAGTELDPLSFSVELATAGVAPTITTQPQDVTVDAGEEAVFTAAATGTPEPAVQWQRRTGADAEWSEVDDATEAGLTLPAATPEQDGTQVRAVFSNGTQPDAVTDPATVTVVPAEEPGEPEEPEPGKPEEPEPGEWEPVIEVFAADGVTPLGDAEVTWGDTVVVEGTGFDPAGNVGGRGAPIPADLPQGSYVVFGKFLDEWQPSAGVPSSARVIGSQKWALAADVLDQVPPNFQGAIRAQWVDIAQDGSFTAELTVAKPVVEDEEIEFPEEGSFGVYTYGAGGVHNADQEQSVPVNVVADPEEPAGGPELTVTPTEGLAVDTVVTVEGTGYAPNRAISVAFTADTVKHEEFGWPVGWLNHEVVTTDENGEFSRELTVSGWVTGTGEDCSEVQCYLATFNSAQASDAVDVDHRAERDQDVFVEVSLVAGYPVPDPHGATVLADPNPVRQGEELTVTGSNLPAGADVTALLEASTGPVAGSLDWGAKESFRAYVTGPIARGSIELDGATENEDGSYRFPAALASVDDDVTVLAFSGGVSFQGHDLDGTAALEIHVANLRVELTQDSALLLADVESREFEDITSVGELREYPGVALATLDPEAFTVEGGTVTAAEAAATLTADGAPAFGSFYEAGTELDPVSLEVSAGSALPVAVTPSTAAETGTVIGSGEVGEDGSFAAAWTVPEDFPVGGYGLVVRDDSGVVLASDTLAVLTAADDEPDPGPEPEPEPEPGSVVVDPDPVQQGATATITGSDLTPGTRVGAVIDAGGAPGTLEWGFKESFRSYVTGPIAQGEITPVAPATATEAGTYVFSEGIGSGDAENSTADFAGAVSFAGHELDGVHALELEIADPSVVVEDGVGHLVADVTSREFAGTSSTGELTESAGVVLAELDLAAGDVGVVEGRLVGTDVPATLTAQGVPAFADFYEEGAELDPVSFSVPFGEAGHADLSTLDVPEATVGQDGAVELAWDVPADFPLGSHTVHLVTDGDAVADTTFSVVAGDAAPGDPDDQDGDRTGSAPTDTSGGGSVPTDTSDGGNRLATTGGEAGALTALAAAAVLLGALLSTRRRMQA